MQKYEKRDMPHLDWLDRITFAEIEKVHAVSGIGPQMIWETSS